MTAKSCQSCGASLYEEETRGLCPRCLAQAALLPLEEPDDCEIETEATPESETTASPEPKSETPAEDCGAGQGHGLGRVGDYELVRELGRGGMGVVYLARQISLNRQVALKMILAGQFASPASVRRFRTEAEAAARLRHPNIVTIFEIGEHQGKPYFSMDYVRGPSLAARIQENPVPPEKAAEYTRTIARAVQHAHDQGILHRDLKPSNVLLDPQDEPHVSDFGLAKEFQSASDLTVSGECLGSPNFMPPEQASGKHGKVSVRSDIYAIGTTLYFLLTGHPPFKAATVSDTLEQLLHHEPASPRLLNASIPPDLETICLKCLEKEPAKRYPTAGALADDLDRFLHHEPIQARPTTAVDKLMKWSRRKPALAGLSAAVLILLLSVLIGSPIALNLIKKERDHGQALLYAADMNLAYQALKDNRLERVHELLDRHRLKKGETDLRGWEWGNILHEARNSENRSLLGHQGSVLKLAFSPDGRYLASCGEDRKMIVWEFGSGEIVAEVPHPHPIMDLDFSPDGTTLFTSTRIPGTYDGYLHAWSADTWQKRHSVETVVILDLAVDSTGEYLATRLAGNTLTLWDPRTLTQLPFQFLGEKKRSYAPVFAPHSSIIAIPENECIALWDLGQEQRLLQVPLPTTYAKRARIHTMAISSDGTKLALGGNPPLLRDLSHPERPNLLKEDVKEAVFVACSHQGDLLALAHRDNSISIWDLNHVFKRGELIGIDWTSRTSPSLRMDGFWPVPAWINLSGSGIWKNWPTSGAFDFARKATSGSLPTPPAKRFSTFRPTSWIF